MVIRRSGTSRSPRFCAFRGRGASRWLAAMALTLALTPSLRAQGLPSRLTDRAFWQMITDFSEPGGFFRSDNFLSNESSFQYVLPELTKSRAAGGVYLGVGPEQNFTYIVALRPKIAFIFDIRRQNMIEHLLYKALIEMSPDRADFLSKLFSRPRPPGLDTSTTADVLFAAFGNVAPDSLAYRRNANAIRAWLVDRHGFALSSEDLQAIAYVYDAFYSAGPDLNYSFTTGRPIQFGRGRMPSYAELMVETDSEGSQQSFLATEGRYRVLRDLHVNNLVVPVVGDFAGPKAIQAVGQYLKTNRATVTAFYTSNVEQYLFRQNDDWRKFYINVATLPLDSASVFIRAVFNGMGYPYQPPSSGLQMRNYGMRSASLLCSIGDLLKAFDEGRLTSYADVIQMSK